MRWLITGASGTVGSAVARRLSAEGHEVVAYVRNAARFREVGPADAEVAEGSIGDPNALAEAAKGAEVLVHSATVRGDRSAERALRWVNIAGTENVVRAAEHAGVRRLVHISCSDVTLANVDRVNWNEDRPVGGAPPDAHARTKLLAEELVLAEASATLETIALRPPLVWGPGDRSQVPAIIAEARDRGGFELIGKGESFISVLYIESLVDAVLSAATRGTSGRAYYLHDNEFITAAEFYGELSAALGLPAPKNGRPYRLAYALAWAKRSRLTVTDVIHRGRPTFFDTHNAYSELGFDPKVSLSEGLAALKRWVDAVGGLEAVAAFRRSPATDADVDDIVRLAGGD